MCVGKIGTTTQTYTYTHTRTHTHTHSLTQILATHVLLEILREEVDYNYISHAVFVIINVNKHNGTINANSILNR